MELTVAAVETEQEIAEVAELAGVIWREYYPLLITSEQIDYMLEQFQSPQAIAAQIEQGYRYCSLMLGQRRIGYLSVKAEGDKLFLSKFYIRQDQRGQGFARQAMDVLERLAREQALHAIWLTTNRHNALALAAYEKLGFRKLRMQVADIGNGFVMDDYVLEKRLL